MSAYNQFPPPEETFESVPNLEQERYSVAHRVGHFVCGSALSGGLITLAAEIAETKWGPMPIGIEVNAALQAANAGGWITVLGLGPTKP